MRCFSSGKTLIVTLSSASYYEEHSSPNISEKLKAKGLSLIESPQARAARTLMVFRPHPLILDKSKDDLTLEISTRNDVKVEQVTILTSKIPILKLRLSSSKEADSLLKFDIKAFSLIIPSRQLEKERFISVNQCLKCYQFDHATKSCPSSTKVCSKCAATDHTHLSCKGDKILCLNCKGNHTAVSYSYPSRKAAANNPSPNTQEITQKPPLSHSLPTTNPAPHPSYAAAASIVSSLPDSTTFCKVQVCASAAFVLAN